jgi:hypothetical protein
LAAKPHTIELLKASGIRGAFFGIESLNYESARTIGKGLRPERALETLHKIREVWGDDVTTCSSFIVGLPHDTEETINSWLTMATDADFPSDSLTIYPLGLSKVYNDRRLWKSELELYPEKYGYSYPDGEKWPNYWVNTQTGMNAVKAGEIAAKYVRRAAENQKKKPGPCVVPGLLNLGYDFKEITGVTKFPGLDDNTAMLEDQYKLQHERNLEYVKKLLS